MTPHKATLAEVVNAFSTSPQRRQILAGWIQYRQALRAIGIGSGFQWLGGSFLEDVETIRGCPPGDIDAMVFFERPANATSDQDFFNLATVNRHLFDPDAVKTKFNVHAFLHDMGANASTLVSQTRYFLLLFTHQRDTTAWKGMLEVDQSDDAEESTLLLRLQTPQPIARNP